jgi:hypothetical protein
MSNQRRHPAPHGEFLAMVENDLPFGDRTARRLMAIARDPRISNRTHASILPPSWMTLYELTKLGREISANQKIRAPQIFQARGRRLETSSLSSLANFPWGVVLSVIRVLRATVAPMIAAPQRWCGCQRPSQPIAGVAARVLPQFRCDARCARGTGQNTRIPSVSGSP